MIPIADVRFDPPIGFQTSGGAGWRTEIIPLANGREARNALWSGALRRWQVTGVPVTPDAANSLIRFFNARSGPAQGFRFSDPFGWRTAETVTPLDQAIGTGDGAATAFQMVLDDGAAVPKVITRPVLASVRVAIDGVETGAFSADSTTGILTFDSAPGDGAVLTAGFEFDLPVRFESDQLDLSYSGTGAMQLVRLSLVELREGG